MLSEIYWSFFTTSIISCLLMIIRLIYKSKCRSCSCCGIKIERDVELEEKIDELELQRSKALGNNDLESNKK